MKTITGIETEVLVEDAVVGTMWNQLAWKCEAGCECTVRNAMDQIVVQWVGIADEIRFEHSMQEDELAVIAIVTVGDTSTAMTITYI